MARLQINKTRTTDEVFLENVRGHIFTEKAIRHPRGVLPFFYAL
jgi:hypothetical protein